MNTLAKKIPGKQLTMVQCLTTLLLVVIICCVSFGTVFSLTLTVDNDVEEAFYKTIEKLDGDPDSIEIPEQIDVNLIFLVKSIGAGVDTVSALLSGDDDKDDVNNPYGDDFGFDADNIQDVKEKALSQDTVNLVAFIVAIVQSFKSSIILGLCNLMLMIMAFTFPLTLLIKGIIALIGFFSNFSTDWGKAFHKVSKAIFGAISLFPVLLLLMILVPEVQFGWAIYSVLWLCVVALVLNLVVSRLKYYEPEDLKYLNILQIVSAVGFGGFLMFFFGFAGSDVINSLWDGVDRLELTSFEAITENILTVILVALIISGLTSILDLMTQSVTRISCMSKSKSDTHLVSTTMGLLTILAVVYLTTSDFELDLGEGATSFWVAALGVVIMFVAEILLKVLPKKLCPAVSTERRREIVTGAYTYEAPVEEAPAEEVPAEEAPAEEAPAEEAPVEEAPAEETSAEETSAT